MIQKEKSTYFAAAIAIVVSFFAVVPWFPAFPQAQLDSSWMLGMNEAVAKGLHFGSNIVFTFGPYASVYTHQYHPQTAPLMYFGSALIAFAVGASLAVVARGNYAWSLLAILIWPLIVRMDSILFFVPLLFIFLLNKLSWACEPMSDRASRVVSAVVLCVSAAMGLLPLIKGTFFILATGVICLGAWMIASVRPYLARSIPLTFLLSMSLAWLVSGQHLIDLPRYFLAMSPIISGYTDAMSLSGKFKRPLFFLIAAAVLLVAWMRTSPIVASRRSQLANFLVLLLTFFLAFKAGFSRDDSYHRPIAGGVLLLVAYLMSAMASRRTRWAVVVFGVLAWWGINGGRSHRADLEVANTDFYRARWMAFTNTMTDPAWLQRGYVDALSSIRETTPLPIVRGSVDIYSYDQSLLIANNFTWSPRPVLQSYSAYTPQLAQLNRDHLVGFGAPENVIFALQTIDDRLPALDDGLSWLALRNNYTLQQVVGPYAIFQRTLPPRRATLSEQSVLSRSIFRLNESITLPASTDWLFAELKLRPTMLGRIVSIIFKLPEVHIEAQLDNGESVEYRIIAGAASAGFVLSPLVLNTKQFVAAMNPATASIPLNQVREITLRSGGAGWLWREKFLLELRSVQEPPL